MRTITVGLALLLAGVSFAGLATGQIIGGDLINIAPTIAEVTIHDGTDSDATVHPNAGGTRSLVVTAKVTDSNGFLTLPALTATRMALVFGGSDVIAEGAAPRVSGSGNDGYYERTFNIPYYFAPGTYTIRVEVDDLLLSATDSTKTFTYTTLLAADPGDDVDLGSGLEPGNPGGIVALAVANTGNAAIDLQVLGDGPLEHESEDGAEIPLSAVAVGTAPDLTGASPLDTSAVDLSGFSLGRATSGAGSSGNVYFRLTVPGNIEFLPAGTYATELTVIAVANA